MEQHSASLRRNLRLARRALLSNAVMGLGLLMGLLGGFVSVFPPVAVCWKIMCVGLFAILTIAMFVAAMLPEICKQYQNDPETIANRAEALMKEIVRFAFATSPPQPPRNLPTPESSDLTYKIQLDAYSENFRKSYVVKFGHQIREIIDALGVNKILLSRDDDYYLRPDNPFHAVTGFNEIFVKSMKFQPLRFL